MNERDSEFTAGTVQAHYHDLALVYGKGENRACKDAYRRAVLGRLASAERVLEIGSGVSPAITVLRAPLRTVCDFSVAMLRVSPNRTMYTCAADGLQLPFPDACFDGIICINVLEHIPRPKRLFAETARVLRRGGSGVFITPNGDCGGLLELIERFRLKLPEGPHKFVRFHEMTDLLPSQLRAVEHRKFLTFPLGPGRLVDTVDAIARGSAGHGLFQLLHVTRA